MKLRVRRLSFYIERPASFHILLSDTDTTLWSPLRGLPKIFCPPAFKYDSGHISKRITSTSLVSFFSHPIQCGFDIYIYYAYFICLPSYRGRQMMPFPLAERAALCRVFQALHVLMAHTLLLPRQSHFKSISLLTLLWIPQVHCPIPLPMLLLQIASHMLTSEWVRPTLIQILAPQ